jgi:hypothetical protein
VPHREFRPGVAKDSNGLRLAEPTPWVSGGHRPRASMRPFADRRGRQTEPHGPLGTYLSDCYPPRVEPRRPPTGVVPSPFLEPDHAVGKVPYVGTPAVISATTFSGSSFFRGGNPWNIGGASTLNSIGRRSGAAGPVEPPPLEVPNARSLTAKFRPPRTPPFSKLGAEVRGTMRFDRLRPLQPIASVRSRGD